MRVYPILYLKILSNFQTERGGPKNFTLKTHGFVPLRLGTLRITPIVNIIRWKAWSHQVCEGTLKTFIVSALWLLHLFVYFGLAVN